MFEITIEIPDLWLFLGLSMVYITTVLSSRIEKWHFQQKYPAKTNHKDILMANVFLQLLIVQTFGLIKRKIPTFHDRNSKSDDEAASSLLLI